MKEASCGGPSPARTLDRFLDGLVTLVQPAKGHRAGLDAALLQALVPADATGHLIDLGAGVGTVGFAAAARAEQLSVTAVEIDAELVACARSALGLPENAGFGGRVRLLQDDAADHRSIGQAISAGLPKVDWLLMNPPFDQPGRMRPSPDAKRRTAHIGEAGLLAAWCRTAAALLRPGGTLGIIHRAGALPELIDAVAGRFGDIRIVPVHPSVDAAASRIVVRAARASRAGMRLAPGLVLHQPGGGWTAEADAILRGRAMLAV